MKEEKRKKGKKLKFLLAAWTVAVLACMGWNRAVTAEAATEVASGNCGKNGDNVTWTLDDEGTLTITGTGEMAGYLNADTALWGGGFSPWRSKLTDIKTVVIEEGVTNIGKYAFSTGSNMTSVSIPSSVVSIEEGAFYRCSRLTSVDIPSSVADIGYRVFESCSGLTSVSIPEGVTSIGISAFYNCSGLTSVSIPSSVTSIGSSAFYNCSGLTSVSIPEGVTSIGSSAFSGCSGLTSVSIPSTVTSISGSAFSGCSSLTDIKVDAENTNYSSEDGVVYNKDKTTLLLCSGGKSSVSIPEGVTSIGESAFSGCSNLTSVSIPEGVTTIGEMAFDGCSSLTSVSIPSGVTSIGHSAFFGCSGLTSVSIPEGVTSIGRSAFTNCSSLTSVNIPSGVTEIEDSVFTNCSRLTSVSIPEGVTSIGSSAFWNCSALTSVSIPEGVTTIGEGAFSGCSGLTSVTIPEGVTSIGSSTFYGCSGLTSVDIPEGVTSIGREAFYGCSGLTSVSIPSSVTSIGEEAFYNCSNLTSVSIPSGVTSINSYMFYGCSSLTDIQVDAGNSVYSSEDGVLYNKEKTTLVLCPRGKSGSVSIPSSVTSIYASMFSGCSSLAEIRVDAGNSMYSSEDGIVYDKEKTTLIICPSGKSGSVSIPSSVTSIGSYAFYGCSGLTNVSIPEGVTSIGSGAFNSCSGLTSVIIPSSVTSIENYAFSGCSALRSVYYAGRSEEWDQISIGSGNDYLVNAAKYYNYTADSAEITAPAAKTLTYTGKAQVLLDAGVSEGTMQYALGSSAEAAPASGWSAEIPGAVNAGTYYVWYRVARTDGSITDPACVTAVIGRAASAPGMPDTAMSVAYSVDKVGKASLKDHSGWEWQASDRDKALTVGGKVSAVAVYSGSDKENYETVSVTVEITRSACRHDSTEVRGAEDASCTADGYTGDTYCRDCGEKVESGTAVKAAGHKWDGGKVTTEPTAEKEGVKTYTCTVCGETKTEAVPKLEDGSGEDEEKEEDKDDKKEDGRVDKEDIYLEDASGFVPGGDGASYWYENGQRQGVKLKEDGTPDESYRGKEVYDPKSDEWYWLDNVQYGTMLKGDQVIDGVSYHFDEITGIMTECSISLESHWETIDGADYWYENGQRQGKDTAHRNYRGKEVYDPESGAWYWLDNVDAGKKAVSKDVYQDALAGDWGDVDNGDGTRSGKWVRYDADGCMVKGWCAGKDAEARTIASPEEAGDEAVYYFDLTYGTMAKGKVTIDGAEYSFDPVTGIMER